jgi:hypothetical protein
MSNARRLRRRAPRGRCAGRDPSGNPQRVSPEDQPPTPGESYSDVILRLSADAPGRIVPRGG